VTYTWYGSPVTLYSLHIYSLHKNVTIYDSLSDSAMYHMDGQSPSGFWNSKFCGMNCIPTPDPSPSPTPDPTPKPDPCDAKCKADKEAQAAIMREFWKFCYDWTVGAFANSFVI
jgi:hypothetical protein